MTEGNRILSVRNGSAAWNPCLLVLRAKGYEIMFWFTQVTENETLRHVEAKKDGRVFTATNEAELLGLVAMWEFRGDDWRTQPGEADVFDELYHLSFTQDFEGNVIKRGGVPVDPS